VWIAISLFVGLALPVMVVTAIVCHTVRGQQKRALAAKLDAERIAYNRETEKLMLFKQLWDERRQMIEAGLPAPNIPTDMQFRNQP
jgi:hypothetical protein